LVCALTLDKSMAKRVVRDAGLRTPPFAVVDRIEDLSLDGMSYPLFAKPVAEGTSKGIDGRSKISSPAELAAVVGRLLEAFGQPVLIEEYLPGREFTTGIVGSGLGARVVGTTEIRIREGSGTSDYSFGMKEEWERWVEYSALGEGALRRSVEELALAVFRLLECRDAARVDIRLDGAGRPSFLEVNPLPGLHPVRSDLPILAAQAGWTYPQLIESIVESALARIDRR
ncbi:MAG: D-alanine--D-alanine ligase, partial [Planctomycetes bacterium]|nr:D-alanine--D-alanine ligase [Planctomycetota bacterium]